MFRVETCFCTKIYFNQNWYKKITFQKIKYAFLSNKLTLHDCRGGGGVVSITPITPQTYYQEST